MMASKEATCEKCRSSEFEYDAAWKEYSCKNCGWIVKDPDRISAIEKAKKDKMVLEGEKKLHPDLVQSAFNHDEKIQKTKSVRRLVWKADARTVQALGKVLYDHNATNRELAAEALQKIEESKKEVIKKVLRGEEKHASQAEIAKAALLSIQSLKLSLIQNLSAKDNSIRKLSAQALQKLHDEKAVEPLINALNDQDIDIRGIAAEALGSNIGEEHVERLNAMLNDESNAVRLYIGIALNKFYRQEVRALLWIIPLAIIVGLFTFVGSYGFEKPSVGLDLGGTLRGIAYLLWVSGGVIALYVLPRFLLRLANVNQRMRDLDKP